MFRLKQKEKIREKERESKNPLTINKGEENNPLAILSLSLYPALYYSSRSVVFSLVT